MTDAPGMFAGLEDVLDLGCGVGVDARATLLRVLTDVYLQRPTHTAEDEHYYTELVLRLIDAADVSERAALATRLAAYPSAPAAVVKRMARDVIEVAGPILRHSPCLTTSELKSIAEERGGAHARIIAARSPAMRPAARPAGPDDGAAAQACELSELFYAAGALERRLILISLDYAPFTSWPPLCALQRADIQHLEAAALRRDTETLIRELGRALGLAHSQACRIVEDRLGEPMVVAARALNVPIDVLQRVLLFVSPRGGQSIDRIYELSELYGEISLRAARRLIAIWRQAQAAGTSRMQYEPVGRRTAADNARRALSELPHRSELEQGRHACSGAR